MITCILNHYFMIGFFHAVQGSTVAKMVKKTTLDWNILKSEHTYKILEVNIYIGIT